MNLKRAFLVSFSFLVAFVCLGVFFGCASTRVRNTESLLSAAGFHAVAPKTPEQQNCYANMRPFKIERFEKDGDLVYAYADKKSGIVYVGDESNFQILQQLGHEQRISDEQLQAAEMNQAAATGWDAWSPSGFWL